MKNHVRELSDMIPEEFRFSASALGWCGRAVDSVADRLFFDGFRNDDFLIGQIFGMNNQDIFVDSAVLSALISSCSFIYIGRDGDSYPKIQVIDGGSATGEIDPVTGMMTEGYAVLERDENASAVLEAYFRPHITQYYRRGKIAPEMTLEHDAPYALLVPMIYRPDAKRPFGHSRISRACMSIMETAVRTLRRSEVSAEFYSFPQKYALGIANDAEFNKRKATISSFLTFSNDEDGNKPVLGQFSQQSMAPFTDQMKMLAALFAGETGLTLDDLGFTTDNPASYDAIRASHETLRLTARKAQRTFGTGLLNAGYLAACVRDGREYRRSAFRDTQPVWMPIFEPDAAALGVLGDAILKINQAVPEYIGDRGIRMLTGLERDAE